MKIIKGENNYKIIISIVVVIAIILATFFLTYAYYTVRVEGTGKKLGATTTNLKIKFEQSANINISGAAPIKDSLKDSLAYTNSFTITNSTTEGSKTDAEYDIYLVIDNIDKELKNKFMKWELYNNSTLISKGDLTYFDVGENKLTDKKIRLNLGQSDNITFRLWMSYSESEDQTNMLGKTITSKLKVISNETL